VEFGDTRASYAEQAAVVLSDVLSGRSATRTYTATVVLHGVTTSGAGYALLRPELVTAPSACNGSCIVSGGAYLASGDATIEGDSLLTVTFQLGLSPWTGLSTLPAGEYRISLAAEAGITENQYYLWFLSYSCPGCLLADTVHYGVGSADVAVTVVRVSA
jgi:hypothetical protein